jgi:hypothetical protein
MHISRRLIISSLVLGGLIEDITLGDLLALFQDQARRSSIFSPTNSLGDRVLQELTGIGPKYSADNKLTAIQRLMPRRGNVPLPQAAAGIRRSGFAADIHLLITSFDYDRNRACFFRSAQASGQHWGVGETAGVTLAEALHASCNAPINYFDAPAMFPDGPGRYWDGAITGCNNPIVAAVTEAIVMGQAPGDIVALSLGSATVALPWPTPADPSDSPYVRAIDQPGLAGDLRKLATAVLDDPPDIASFLAHVMTGGGGDVPAPAQSRVSA